MKDDHQIIGIDKRPDPAHTQIVGDVRTNALLENVPADILIHCAAQIEVPFSVDDPVEDASNNIEGTLMMLEHARHAGVRHFIYFSTAAVYGDPEELPIKENAPVSPMSPYGLSKHTGERYARLYSDIFGLKVCVIRPFNIWSERQRYGVVKAFSNKARAKESLVIYGSGEQTRDFIHVSDVVALVRKVMDKPRDFDVVNACTGRPVSINELATAFLDKYDYDAPIMREPPMEGDILESIGDPSHAEEYGFSASKDILDVLKESEEVYP